MSSKHPVVVYGASGYTGRLVVEYLREHNLPFVAAGRDADRTRKVVESIPGIETATYDVVAVEHTVEALSELFEGAKVVCNMVGPFATLGHEVAQACLNAGAHYLDTTGEQDWIIDAEAKYGAAFAEKGLVLSPGLAQMYTTGEIAANVCLEQEAGLETLDILVLWKGFPTYASTQTIFVNLLTTPHYLENNEYVAWEGIRGYEVAVPGQHATALTLPWGGTSHPVWFKNDPRVANVKVLGGVFDRTLMEGVVQMAQMVEEQIKPLPAAERQVALSKAAEGVQAGMPPRENPRVNRSIDSVYATGPLSHVRTVIRGNCNYKQTGLLQAYGAHHLVHGRPLQTGFASGCQAFGHRRLLGVLQSFGLVGEPEVTRS
ncbi:hypothetical protein PAI11_07620 [Patulibacter medicamentivorans]|uniref:Uncharacterized protein n=1 Tax=Patulibacter medicamentivorans TaxID=1097667 RepID=H0E1V0_9ACTN|nr:DUF5938 domain-containing protein [Patulibacter medicamentivorans]EHN12342.1 hypothetical protein PAI11_07620 [Patulibacter medicamentivorans]